MICFFSIPLVTIVAMFVFKIFMPIVVFLFSLYYLLLLKFCIKPTLSFDGALKSILEIPVGDIEAGLTASQINQKNSAILLLYTFRSWMRSKKS